MANTIKHKRGSGSDPAANDLVVGELAIRTDTGTVFTKKTDGTVVQITGGGGNAADADTVDSLHASSFLRSDAADSASGKITFNADTRYGTQSSDQGSGLAVQRVWSKTVSTGQLYQLGTWNDTEGDVALLIQVSSETSSNSGTATYLFQGGYNAVGTNYNRLYPQNMGRGHGNGPDTGENSNAWQVYIYRSTGYTYGLAIGVASGNNKLLIVTATELKRGMTFSDQSSNSVITSFTTGGDIFSHRTLLAENVKVGSSLGSVWHTANDGPGNSLDADTVDGFHGSSFLRSDANDTASGQITLTSSAQYPLVINSSNPGKLVLQGGGSPYIRFREGTTDKAYIQWHTSGYFQIQNDESGEGLRIGSGSNGLTYGIDGTYNTVWHAGNDGSGSGLDADALDGAQGSSFLRSDTSTTFNASGNDFNFSSDGSRTLINFQVNGSTKWRLLQNNSGNNLNFDNVAGTEFQIASNKAWHAGNDGSGSGLDADTLDGVQGASYLRSDANDTYTGTLSITGQIINSSTAGASGAILGNLEVGYGAAYNSISARSNNALHLNYNSSGIVYVGNNNKVFHAGNDGAGSGLDADTLDGVQGSNYMGKTGNYWNANNWISCNSSHGLYWPNNNALHWYPFNSYLRLQNNQTAGGINLYFGSTRGYVYANNSNQIGFLNHNAGWSLKVDSSGNVTATGNVTAYSDRRIKENIRTVDKALDKVQAMRGVYFDRKDTGKASVGVIAQEIEQILPEVVETQDTRTLENQDALTDLKTVSYGNIVGVLIEAVKELRAEVADLKSQLEAS